MIFGPDKKRRWRKQRRGASELGKPQTETRQRHVRAESRKTAAFMAMMRPIAAALEGQGIKSAPKSQP